MPTCLLRLKGFQINMDKKIHSLLGMCNEIRVSNYHFILVDFKAK